MVIGGVSNYVAVTVAFNKIFVNLWTLWAYKGNISFINNEARYIRQ